MSLLLEDGAVPTQGAQVQRVRSDGVRFTCVIPECPLESSDETPGHSPRQPLDA